MFNTPNNISFEKFFSSSIQIFGRINGKKNIITEVIIKFTGRKKNLQFIFRKYFSKLDQHNAFTENKINI